MTRDKRPPGAKPPESSGGRSLRDQVKALLPQLPAKPAAPAAPPRAAPRPAPPASKDTLSFHELAGGVRPLPGSVRVASVAPPAPVPTHRAAPKKRLWVEQREGAVRARADDVPARWLDDLEAGRVVPRRQIDLHRKSASDARQVLEDGIRQSRREGVGCVLVLCGRGKHSST
ncbi:MAG TPA: Smr/MutS family protein, partial [Polyangiaceae bacterium]|nr:Smr/MutS family protein [Polyangiaceae bacterium]